MYATIQFKLIAFALLAVLTFSAGWMTNGWRYEKRIAQEKIAQEKAIQAKELANQIAADEIRKNKDAQINSINSQLADALIQLRNRASRSEYKAIIGQDGTGKSLSAEDAEFLIREATRADQIRVALDACYQQYDAVK
jgi:hypothetical protein